MSARVEQIREGDKVTVEYTVAHSPVFPGRDGPRLRVVTSEGVTLGIDPAQVVGHKPKPLKVGDIAIRVTRSGEPHKGQPVRVLGISRVQNTAACQAIGGNDFQFVAPLSDMRHFPEPQHPTAAMLDSIQKLNASRAPQWGGFGGPFR